MKLLLVAVAVAAVGVLIGFYVSNLTTLAGSPAYSVPVQNVNGHPVVNLEIQTVAAVGPKLEPNPDWVSYLDPHDAGRWKRETVWDLPANATVHVTMLQLRRRQRPAEPVPRPAAGHRREPGPRRRQAGERDRPGRRVAHVRGAGARASSSPLPGVADNAKNQCGFAPCALSNAHRTITFTFHTTTPGHYRWQCFVPCAAGWLVRVRRADADDRLHGRLPQREGLMAA